MKKLVIFTFASMVSLMAMAQGFTLEGIETRSQDDYDYYPEESDYSYTREYFNGNIKESPVALTVGYVNKDWVTKFAEGDVHENLWGQRDKKLHGFQVGFSYQPRTRYGLGLNTGLFYECYISVSSQVKEAGYDDFTEHNVYLPLHAQFSFPFSPKCSMSVYGGVGMNLAICGVYAEYDRYYDYYDGSYHKETVYEEFQTYGKGQWPRRLNLSTEYGVKFRYSDFQVGVSFSRGLTNHNLYKDRTSKQNKFALTFSYILPLSEF